MKYHKRILLLCLFNLMVVSAFSQATRGRILDQTTGESLPFATIFSPNSDFTSSSDADGYFYMPGRPIAFDTLTVSYVGYQTQSVALKDYIGSDLITIRLQASSTLPTVEVTVPYDYGIGSGSVITPSIKDLKSTPAMAGEADPLKALAALPGVSVGVEGTSALLLRGGNANQTNLVIDGVQLLNVNHVGGLISAVPSFGLKSAVVYKGGMPGRFGGRLSGTVDFRFRDGRKDANYREHTVGTALVRTGLEGPIGKKSSFLVNGRLSYPTLIRSAIKSGNVTKGERGTNQHVFLGDALGKLHTELGAWRLGATLFLSGDTGYDQFDGSSAFDIQEYEWGNQVYSLEARRFFGARTEFISQVSLLRYHQRFTTLIRNQREDERTLFNQVDELKYNRLSFEARVTHHLNSAMDLSGGIEASRRGNEGKREELIRGNTQIGLTQSLTAVSPFVQVNYVHENSRLRLIAALRSDIVPEGSVDPIIQPRLRGSYRIGKSAYLNAGYDVNVQFENQLQTTVSLFPTDIILLADETAGSSSSKQFHLGAGGRIGTTVWSIEGYHKSLKGLTQIRPGQEDSPTLYRDFDATNYAFDGTGKAIGLEFYLRRQAGKIRYSLAYTLSKSERRYTSLNEGDTFPFTFDRRHDINAQLAYTLGTTWTFNADFTYQTGIAFTAPIFSSATFDIFGNLNNGRYPPFHRLNISFQKSWSAKRRSGKQHLLTFSIYNAYARKNPYFIDVQIKRTEIVDPLTGDRRTAVERVITSRAAFGFLPGISYQVKINGKK